MGAVTSLGTGVPDFADSLRAGRSGIGPLKAFDPTGFAHGNAGEVGDFEAADWFRRADPQEYGRAAQFTVAATRQATQDAGLGDEELRARRVLVSIGTTDGGTRDLDRLAELRFNTGEITHDPHIARKTGAERLSDAVVDELALEDVESVTVPVACAAGNYAVGQGVDALRSGECEVALCGGADALTRKTFAGFYRLGAMAPDLCRPFDTGRSGMLVGEGAGMFVLETLESALARGARIHAEVLGYGLSCDASHPVAPDRDGVARAVAAAHRDARVTGGQIDYICAHGTGTKANDKVETAALRDVFGPELPPTAGIKSMLGHSMGAASALGAIACVLAMNERFLPPTVNHRETDPECAVDCVPNVSVAAEPRITQNNGMAFGGNNAVLVLGRYDGPGPEAPPKEGT
ncbi:beta-ketoacyl synthase [Streptomyces sp. NBC_00091]|uniref:beta-ketoacyl-[acyl-carrier-protein] synthase family protein n=1 Tax=Streptomyces sp. NBC_00091 TaxID=2975648 RepID=UPI00224D38A3|nr:beta-ketoacyl-[acyl-carrier-protein] synthase family protein [Streptomyces sp. NBC_00091]MCX5375332.1 beta-ketoacyl-[acyl-carrier-protein] synthase family protein [Streptomyces sp. NBC_00091]